VLANKLQRPGEPCVSSKTLPLGSNSSVAEASLLALYAPLTIESSNFLIFFAGNFVMACLGQCLKHLIGITIAFSTAPLWLFGAIGSTTA
jgi:hypothetical protein